jgi:putative tryptophan/tyrosine transport system substrate-binding protein
LPTVRLVYDFGLAWLVLAGVALLCACSRSVENQPVIAYVGYLSAETDKPYQRFLDAMRKTQPELHGRARFEYVAGTDNDDDALAMAIGEAARQRPTVLVTPTGISAEIASRVAGDTPIVFTSYLDPVVAGFAKSMRLPGGKITGISLADWLDEKRLEILHDAYPHARTVAVLADHSWAKHYDGEARIAAEATRLGLRAEVIYADTADDVDRAMSLESAKQFDAWYFLPTYVSYLAQASIVSHLTRLDRPGIFGTTDEVSQGGQIGYAQDTSFVWATVSELVARVASGENAGSIPIERPRRFVLSVRPRTEPAGQQLPASLIRRADLVF